MCCNLLDVQETNSGAESEMISLDGGLNMEGIPVLQLWCCETFSHSDAEGNIQRPSGTRQSLSNSIDHSLWLTTFQATFQSVYSQSGFTFTRTKQSFVLHSRGRSSHSCDLTRSPSHFGTRVTNSPC